MIPWKDMVRFVRILARQRLSPVHQRTIRSMAREGLPWEQVTALACMEGVAGLAYVHLRDLGLLDALPEPVSYGLEAYYHQTGFRTRAALAQAEEIARICERAGIPVIGLQGLSLVPAVYRNPGLRHLSDLDLMVREDRKGPFKEALARAGFGPLDSAYPDVLVRDGVPVDLHTHPLNVERIRARRHLFPGSLAPMWERARPLFASSDGLLTLHPSDNLVALAAHALKHGYEKLFWIMDLHEWVQEKIREEEGWCDAADRAGLWRQEKVLAYTVLLVSRVFGWRIPRVAQERLGPDSLNALEKHLIRLKGGGMPSPALGWLLEFESLPKVSGRVDWLLGNLFPEANVMGQVQKGRGWRRTALPRLRRAVDAVITLADAIRQTRAFS